MLLDAIGSRASVQAWLAMVSRLTTAGLRRTSSSTIAYSVGVSATAVPLTAALRADRVDGERTRTKPHAKRRGRASHQRTQAGQQLLEIERFHEVVVTARIQALNAIGGRVAGGEHEHGGGEIP